jgi:hypothetical protein
MHGVEHELTLRLERATDLSERAKRANDAAQHEIERALEIAGRNLRDVSREVRVARGAVAGVVARALMWPRERHLRSAMVDLRI